MSLVKKCFIEKQSALCSTILLLGLRLRVNIVPCLFQLSFCWWWRCSLLLSLERTSNYSGARTRRSCPFISFMKVVKGENQNSLVIRLRFIVLSASSFIKWNWLFCVGAYTIFHLHHTVTTTTQVDIYHVFLLFL